MDKKGLYRSRQDFLFCKCGSMLHLTSKFAHCLCCSSKQSLKGIIGEKIHYTVSAEEIRKHLNLEPFVKIDGVGLKQVKIQDSTTNQTCPKCSNTEAEYYSRQMRSADEGQTIFYTCVRCKHKWSENS